jgi:hypothetical protein
MPEMPILETCQMIDEQMANIENQVVHGRVAAGDVRALLMSYAQLEQKYRAEGCGERPIKK